jgi:hypothetical protein
MLMATIQRLTQALASPLPEKREKDDATRHRDSQ